MNVLIVLLQTFNEIEIIVVNDGSFDNSREIVKKYQDMDSRVKIIDKKSGGLSSARNTGIKNANSDYIMFVDDDDHIDINIVKEVYTIASKDNLDVVVFDIMKCSQNGNEIWQDSDITGQTVISGIEYLNQFMVGKCCPSVCNKMRKKSLYTDNNIFHPENISYGEDGSTSPRLMVNAKRVGKTKGEFFIVIELIQIV